MPMYEFECRSCGHDFEALRPMGDTGRTLRCPKCDAQSPAKKLSVFAAGSSSDRAPAPCGASGGCGPGSRSGFG